MPSVPTPAPAVISPVGFSSTVILIILEPETSDSITCFSTFLKKFKLFILLIDLVVKISLKGSPSSISSLFLITSSSVTLFPNILILSTKNLSDSLTKKVKFILSSIISSVTVAEIDSNCSEITISSINSTTLSIVLIE